MIGSAVWPLKVAYLFNFRKPRISRLEKGTLDQFFEPKLAPIDPTMEVALVKHDLRNISAFGADGIRADRQELQRPELQCKMHVAFYTVALSSWLPSHPPLRPKYSVGHA